MPIASEVVDPLIAATNVREVFKRAAVSIVKAISFIAYMVVDSAFVVSKPRERILDLVFVRDGDNQATTMQNVDLDVMLAVEINGLQHVAISYVRVIIGEANGQAGSLEDAKRSKKSSKVVSKRRHD